VSEGMLSKNMRRGYPIASAEIPSFHLRDNSVRKECRSMPQLSDLAILYNRWDLLGSEG
jgi:hypothetical protein